MTEHDVTAEAAQRPDAQARDPRMDPAAGDGVEAGGDARYILRAFEDDEGPQVTYSNTPDGLPRRTCTLATWRRWARHGTVVAPR